jgi:hypothetical protein
VNLDAVGGGLFTRDWWQHVPAARGGGKWREWARRLALGEASLAEYAARIAWDEYEADHELKSYWASAQDPRPMGPRPDAEDLGEAWGKAWDRWRHVENVNERRRVMLEWFREGLRMTGDEGTAVFVAVCSAIDTFSWWRPFAGVSDRLEMTRAHLRRSQARVDAERQSAQEPPP